MAQGTLPRYRDWAPTGFDPEGAFLGDAHQRFEGKLWIASDRELVSLPAGGGMTIGRLEGR